MRVKIKKAHDIFLNVTNVFGIELNTPKIIFT